MSVSTTAHSPNRKERDPAKRWRAKARGNAIETKKDRIVDGVAIGKTLDQAAIEARMSPEGLRKLIKTHPGLKKRIEKAKEEFEEQCSIAKGEVGSRIVRIASRVGDTVLTTTNEKIIIQGGLAIMRGCGVLDEGGVQIAVQVVNEPPKYIEVRGAEPDAPFREMVEV